MQLIPSKNITNFSYISKEITPEKLIDAWRKLSTKYEGVGKKGTGTVRQTMLDVLKFDTQLDPENVRLLTKKTTMANGLPGQVYTGVAHMPIDRGRRQATLHTLAGNPLSIKKPIYKGAVDSVGNVIEGPDDNYRFKIDTTSETGPIYQKRLGYIDSPKGMYVGEVRDYRRSL